MTALGVKTSFLLRTLELLVTRVSGFHVLPVCCQIKGLLAPELLQKMPPAPKEKTSFAVCGVPTCGNPAGARERGLRVWAAAAFCANLITLVACTPPPSRVGARSNRGSGAGGGWGGPRASARPSGTDGGDVTGYVDIFFSPLFICFLLLFVFSLLPPLPFLLSGCSQTQSMETKPCW